MGRAALRLVKLLWVGDVLNDTCMITVNGGEEVQRNAAWAEGYIHICQQNLTFFFTCSYSFAQRDVALPSRAGTTILLPHLHFPTLPHAPVRLLLHSMSWSR